MTWTRHEGLRNGRSEFALVQRAYTQEGKLYPRMVISVYEDYLGRKGATLSYSRKLNRRAWWEETAIPVELIPEAIEILAEAADLLKEKG